MKFHSATTTTPRVFVSLEADEPEPTTMLVPAGADVSAVSVVGGAYHLNYRDPDGRTWDATVPSSELILGPVIATVNEG